ncbi:hypothetical protein J4421_05015 [Candidatus Woesearchaeota archaeon]|nr:hypothetical protein [Candidatus Woesearchaeota archaeon]
MVEPLSIIGLLILAIVILFFNKIMSVVVKILFYWLLVIFVLILFFGVSLNTAWEWSWAIMLWTF